jgi:hypothetical protein
MSTNHPLYISQRGFLYRGASHYSSILRSTSLSFAHRGARPAALLRVLLGNEFTTVMEFLECGLCWSICAPLVRFGILNVNWTRAANIDAIQFNCPVIWDGQVALARRIF